MDDDLGGLAGAFVVLVLGVFLLAGWLLYKLIEAIVQLVQQEWERYQQEKWERQRAARMVATHKETIREIDDTVAYWGDFHKFVDERAAEAESRLQG